MAKTAQLNLASLLVVLSLGGVTETAFAGGTIEQAKQWYQEGDKAETAGDCGTAIQKFKLALEVKETPQLQLRIGRCQDVVGALADAFDSYQQARKLAQGNDKLVAVVDAQLVGLKPRVPRLSITVEKPPRDLVVKVNGAPIESLFEDRYLNPGEVVVTAGAAGFRPFSAKMHLEAREKRTVAVLLVPSAASAPPGAKVEAPFEKSGPSPVSFVLLGLGVAGVGVGTGLTVHGFGLQSRLEDDAKFGCHVPAGGTTYVCKSPTFDGKKATDVQSQSNTFETAGIPTLAVGAALATVGVVLLFVTRHDVPKSHPAVSFEPVVAPGFAFGALSGRF